MKREFIKGNDAIAKASLIAGCTQYYGYPITPSSEIVHACALLYPKVGAEFVQAESEVAAINMCYGASSAGRRVMTASSSPGISLKQEGISYIAAAELPVVIVNVQRAGPGLGNIFPEQADYNQCVKGGGHGNYKLIALAPNSAQEMCDLTIKAFELADRYRCPVMILADAFVGQMMEPVTFPEVIKKLPEKTWAIKGTAETKNVVTSIRMSPEEMEELNILLQNKYKEVEEKEPFAEEYLTDDAEHLIIAYGVTSRIARSSVDDLRSSGIKAGLFRPITLFPMHKKRLNELLSKIQSITVFELSNGQLVDDIRLIVTGKVPVYFYGRMGGVVPSQVELTNKAKELIGKKEI